MKISADTPFWVQQLTGKKHNFVEFDDPTDLIYDDEEDDVDNEFWFIIEN